MKTQHLMRGSGAKDPERKNSPIKRHDQARLRKELEFWERNINSILIYRKPSQEIPQNRTVKRLLSNLNHNRDYYSIRRRMKKLRKRVEVTSNIIDLYSSVYDSPLGLIGSVISIISFLSHHG